MFPRASSDRAPRLRFEDRLFLTALASGLPGSALAVALLWWGDYGPVLFWSVAIPLVTLWVGIAWIARRRIGYSLRTIANLLEALRREDFSMRARHGGPGDSLGEVFREVNELRDTLRNQRLDALEATAMLRSVMTEIDVAILTFDRTSTLRLVNRAAERLLDRPRSRLLGQSASELGLDDLLSGEPVRIIERSFPGGIGRWGLRRSVVRVEGRPHELLVVADLSRTLRDEERRAWQRLIRVIGHELNNSLTPIKSMAASLRRLLSRSPIPERWPDDAERSLAVIEQRADDLSRFVASYSRLARLPPPEPQAVELGALARHVASLETRVPVLVKEGPDLTIAADRGQLEQLLINLVRNAAEAVEESDGGEVHLGWHRAPGAVTIWVRDDGPGASNPSNLFVPFFTTKPGGSGIGLVLSRQIAEAHGGDLDLANRTDGPGCEARLRLPLR